MSSVWAEALPKIEALIVEHRQGGHRGNPVTACPSCLFTTDARRVGIMRVAPFDGENGG